MLTFRSGIVANAASAATYFSVKGHGLSIFRDGVRLALVTFLFASSLWALADFIVLSSEFDKGCQITLSIGSAFDQIARVAFAQFLLVGAQGGFKLTLGTFLPQATVFLRFVLGVVYASFRRPQFQPICVRQTGILPIGIAVLSLDATLILFFVFKVNQKRSYLELVEEVKRTKTLFLSIGGFAVWTALSAPMILGIKSFNLTLRTVPPAVGLLVLISEFFNTKIHNSANVLSYRAFLHASPARRHRTRPHEPHFRQRQISTSTIPPQQRHQRTSYGFDLQPRWPD